MTNPTTCQCPGPGHCPLQGCYKTQTLWENCQNNPGELKSGLAGFGVCADETTGQVFIKGMRKVPGKSVPPVPDKSYGLGDRLEQALTFVGITKERVEQWVGAPCGCTERKEKLNKLGRWVSKALGFKKQETSKIELTGLLEGKPVMTWAYGITTVPSRLKDLFPRTLKSLQSAGFDRPHIFVDGAKDGRDYEQFGLEITCRWPNVRTAGNWVLSLYELYIRNPDADRFAIFQDDFVTSLNLQMYLSCCNYPEKGYWNLYTFPCNQRLCPEEKTYQGWYPADQYGKGAVALVFNREAVCTLLSSRKLVDRPQDVSRGHKAIDGGIIDALHEQGWVEYVHNPSLVQHIGQISSMGNNRHPQSESFPGEQFDLMTLVPNREIIDAKLKEWETERQSIERAMKEDEERLAKASTAAERAKFQAHVLRYKKRLSAHLRDYSKRLSK